MLHGVFIRTGKICLLSVSIILSFHSKPDSRTQEKDELTRKVKPENNIGAHGPFDVSFDYVTAGFIRNLDRRNRLVEEIRSEYNIHVKAYQHPSIYSTYYLEPKEMVGFLRSFRARLAQVRLHKSPLPVTVTVYRENYRPQGFSAIGRSDIQFIDFQSVNVGHKSAAAAVEMIKGIRQFRAEHKEDLDLIRRLGADLSYNPEYAQWFADLSHYYDFIENLAEELRRRKISRRTGNSLQQPDNSRALVDVTLENHILSDAFSLFGPDLFQEGGRAIQAGSESHSAVADWLVENLELVEGAPRE